MKGVQEVHIGEKAFILTCIVLIIAVAVGYHHLFVEQQEELLTANNVRILILVIVVVMYWLKGKLHELEKMSMDLQVFYSHFPSSLVQLTAGVEEFTTYGKKTSFELSISSKFTSSVSFPTHYLKWQLYSAKENLLFINTVFIIN